jgi:hypothetical protein
MGMMIYFALHAAEKSNEGFPVMPQGITREIEKGRACALPNYINRCVS